MRKQLRFLLLLWLFGYTLSFPWGALAYDYPPTKVSLVADFGAQGGLWLYGGSAGWSQLTSASSNLMVSTPGKRLYSLWAPVYPKTPGPGTLVANFPGHGLYQYRGNTSQWYQLTPNDSVEYLVRVPMIIHDWYSPWYSYDYIGSDIYGDYASLGIWKYSGDIGAWVQITVANPDKMLACGWNLVANFPGDGLYQYDGAAWTQLTPNDTVENLLAIGGKIYADFGSLGLLKYDGEWHNLSYANPDKMQAVGDNLVANFPGSGLYWYSETTSSWMQLTPNDTVQALIGVSGNLYADYGPLGLWKWNQNDSWFQISSADPSLLFLGQYVGMFANFPGYGGLYRYNGYNSSNWAPLTDNSGITNMAEVEF
jgi:hypothetical protein